LNNTAQAPETLRQKKNKSSFLLVPPAQSNLQTK